MGKSAQFPFHLWLPDAMEGPTPVSALIHAATMVAAGVYLVARAYPIFLASGDALTVVAIIGLITALMASTIALTATDLKRILAYSTISHLGLMMLSLGALGYTAALFHLMAHGFAKALLFLGAGSVLHSTQQQDIRHMGGLRRAMPLTALLFSLGALSLGGIPILAGFWSKDEVLAAVWSNDEVLAGVSHDLPTVFIVLALLTALLSALYMARAMYVVFFGPSPEGRHHDHPVHDAPPAMAGPMVLLGVLAAGFGLISFNWPGPYNGIGTFLFYEEAEGFHFTWWLGILSTGLAVAAFTFGYLAYVRRSVSLEGIRGKLSPIIRVVERKYYVDEAYQWVVDRVIMAVSGFIALFDRAVVNDVLVNGSANSVRRVGVAMRLHVTGHVYSYALVMALGAVALAILWWWRVA
jgi:NADH-quinone oxidoreductase subunit L